MTDRPTPRHESRLLIDGEEREASDIGEYPSIYREFVDLINERRSLVDVAPLRLVADCLMLAKRSTVADVTI